MLGELKAEDLEEALDFAQKAHEDSAWKQHTFKREVLRANLSRMIGDPKHFACVYRKNGAIVGYWLGHLGKFDFSDVTLGMESGIYIDRAHRGGRIAWVMYQAFIKWCEGHGVEPLVSIYFDDNEDNEKTYQFFRKSGMIECGRVFRRPYGLR